MSHERYSLEDRTKNHWRNPEWEKLSGRENRMPNQFGQEIVLEPDITSNVITDRPQIFPYVTGESVKNHE